MNSESPQERGTPVGRRVFLGTLALGALGVVAAPPLQRGVEAFSAGPPTGTPRD